MTEVRSPEALYLYRVSRPATSVTIFAARRLEVDVRVPAASPPIV